MPIERGSMTYRMARIVNLPPVDLVANLRTKTLPEIRKDYASIYDGYVSPLHSLDCDLSEEKMIATPNLVHGAFANVQRRIPAKLLASKLAAATEAYRRANGTDRISKREKADIKKAVVSAMLPEMPEAISDIPFVAYGDYALIQATTDTAWDRFVMAWTWANKQAPALLDFHGMAAEHGVKARQLDILTYCDGEPTDILASHGADFMMWLWFGVILKGGGRLKVKLGNKEHAMEISADGPLHLEGNEDRIVIKRGPAGNIKELVACLKNGKKATRIGLNIALNGSASWFSLVLDHDLTVRGLRADATSKGVLADRVGAADTLRAILHSLVGTYLSLRADAKAWDKVMNAIRAHIAEL